MKRFNFSIFLGCCAISIGIIIASMIIAGRLPETFSGTLNGTISDSSSLYGNSNEFEEYLVEFGVTEFCHIDMDELDNLIKSGELKGTYTTVNGTHIFSRDKLSEWLINRMESEK